MTIEVLVSHMQPGYDKPIEVLFLSDDGVPIGTPSVTIHPGMCQKFYVYQGQNLFIKEVPKSIG